VTASSTSAGIVGFSVNSLIDSAKFNGHIYGSRGVGNGNSASKLGGIAGYIEQAVIVNVVSNGDVIVDGSFGGNSLAVGGIVGDIEETALENVVSNGDVQVNVSSGGNAYRVGGIAGEKSNGGIQNVVSNGDVIIDTSSGGQAMFVGGIAGSVERAFLVSSLAKGNVRVSGINSAETSASRIGGAVGYIYHGGLIDVDVLGGLTVVDGESVGGIVGWAYFGSGISRSSFSGALNLTFDSREETVVNVGGAIGVAELGVTLSSTSVTQDASVTVSAPFERVGGPVGYARNGVLITDSYNRAPVSGFNLVGGIVGKVEDKSVTVYNTYNTGTVTSGTGAAEPDNDVFAAGGNFKEGLSLSNTFDTQTTGTATSATGVVGNTTAAMKTKLTFEVLGFDFSSSAPIWAIDSSKNDGYPYLIEASLSTQPVVAPAPAGSAVASMANVELGKVSFAAGSTKLSKGAQKILRAAAASMKASGYKKATVRVYATSSNPSLSLKRAQVIAKYLKKQGVIVTISKQAQITKSNKLNNKARIFGRRG
jgi:outer membrane protein OmpA-like peptidoglycan-associated protein